MNFYKLLDIETGEDLYVNPKHIVFYMRTDDGVLIDNGSVRILTKYSLLVTERESCLPSVLISKVSVTAERTLESTALRIFAQDS